VPQRARRPRYITGSRHFHTRDSLALGAFPFGRCGEYVIPGVSLESCDPDERPRRVQALSGGVRGWGGTLFRQGFSRVAQSTRALNEANLQRALSLARKASLLVSALEPYCAPYKRQRDLLPQKDSLEVTGEEGCPQQQSSKPNLCMPLLGKTTSGESGVVLLRAGRYIQGDCFRVTG
jgi:hypothetical protein